MNIMQFTQEFKGPHCFLKQFNKQKDGNLAIWYCLFRLVVRRSGND